MVNTKDLNQHLTKAEEYFQKNKYELAKELLISIIAQQENNAKANELLAYILGNEGKNEESFRLLGIACTQDDCSPEAFYYYGSIQLGKKLYRDAILSFTHSLNKGGEFFEALHDIATAYASLGDLENALVYYQKCLGLKVKSPELFFNIARLFDDLKRYEDALVNYNDAIQLKPDYAEAFNNKGAILSRLKRYIDALVQYDHAIELKPDYAEAYFNKANTLNELGQLADALVQYDHAIELKPDYADAYNNKGTVLNKLKNFKSAIKCFDRAINLDVAFAKAWSNRGISFQELNNIEQALDCYERALTINACYADPWLNKASALNHKRDYENAYFCYQKGMSLAPNTDWVLGYLYFSAMKICLWKDFDQNKKNIIKKISEGKKVTHPFATMALTDNPELQKKSAEIYVASNFQKSLSFTQNENKKSSKKIRIGYFSADFRHHATYYLTAELFELHDTDKFEIVAFSFNSSSDSNLTSRLENSFSQFFRLDHASTQEIIQVVKRADLDIAVDLMGHTAGSRLEIFSQRVAPVQISYLGYPGTTGAGFIDYILADKNVIPHGYENFYTEKIIRLPSFQVNDRKRNIADKIFTRSDLGIDSSTFVFCCFNNSYKIQPELFNSWMNILCSVQDSVLYIYVENQWAANNLMKEAKLRGIDSNRLIFAKAIPYDDYLARYKICDLFLDTFPYNGGATASDALWAGLPVLTLMGRSFSSRMASSLLNALDLPELISKSQKEYESIAIELAFDHDKLQQIKKKLDQTRGHSLLFDTPKFTKNLEKAYLEIHKINLAGLDSAHIDISS